MREIQLEPYREELFESFSATMDVQSDKDDLTAIFFWERLMSFEGLPDDARTYAEEVIDLYRRRLDIGGGKAVPSREDDGEDISAYSLNLLLRQFIWKLEDIEELGVSGEAAEKIAAAISLYKQSIAE